MGNFSVCVVYRGFWIYEVSGMPCYAMSSVDFCVQTASRRRDDMNSNGETPGYRRVIF